MELFKKIKTNVEKYALGLLAAAAINSVAGENQNTLPNSNEERLLAKIIFGEGRNCSKTEMVVIGYTALNRLNHPKINYGNNLVEIRGQYSCFSSKASNKKIMDEPEKYEPDSFRKCLGVARGILNGNYLDVSNGATHYFNPKFASPFWQSHRFFKRIGRISTERGLSKHIYYREKQRF